MKLKRNALLIIVSILFFHVLVNFYILNKSEIIRTGDGASRITEGLRFHRTLINKEYKKLGQIFLILLPPSHPKFFPLIEGLILSCLEKIGLKDINYMILFSNALFLFILLISVFKIGCILYSKKIGLLAAILLSFSPLIFGYSRISMLDFPLTAMISLCFLSLLKTKNFSSSFFSLLTGILFSLAQFTKETAIIFILPPFLYYSFNSFHIKEKRKKRFMNFSITLLLFIILIGTVYFNPINKEIFRTYWGKSFLIYSCNETFFYIKYLPLLFLGIFFLIILFPLILNYLFNIRKRNLFLIFWFFVPLLIFSISPNKTCRFLMPILPPLFLLLSSEVFSSFFLNIRKIYISILIFSICFQYIIFNFFPRLALYPFSHIISSYNIPETGLLSIYRDKDFNLVEKIIDVFKKEKSTLDRENIIIFTFRLGIESVLGYEFELRNMPFFVLCPQSRDEVDAPPPGKIDWKECLLTADYVVDKTGDLGNRGHLEDIAGEFKKSLEINYKMFEKIATFKTQENESIYVYKKVKYYDDNSLKVHR